MWRVWCAFTHAAKLTAASAAERNDIVGALSHSAISLYFPPSLPLVLSLAIPQRSFAGSLNCTAQQCFPTAAAAPA